MQGRAIGLAVDIGAIPEERSEQSVLYYRELKERMKYFKANTKVQLDIGFVLDGTASMGPAQQLLRSTVATLAYKLRETLSSREEFKSAEITLRFSAAFFGDNASTEWSQCAFMPFPCEGEAEDGTRDEAVFAAVAATLGMDAEGEARFRATWPLLAPMDRYSYRNAERVCDFVNRPPEMYNGGDEAEDVPGGIMRAVRSLGWSSRFRYLIFVGDAPGHGRIWNTPPPRIQPGQLGSWDALYDQAPAVLPKDLAEELVRANINLLFASLNEKDTRHTFAALEEAVNQAVSEISRERTAKAAASEPFDALAFPEMWCLKTPGEQCGAKAIQHFPLAGMPARRPGDHLVLVLDYSGSMQEYLSYPDPESPTRTRLSAVHLACDALLAQRRTAAHCQSSQLPPDRITAVAFGSSASTDGEFMTVGEAAAAVAAWDPQRSLGGTNYKAGLEEASSAISRVSARDPSLRPFLVFLSDGSPSSPDECNPGSCGPGLAEIAQAARDGKAAGMRMLFVLCDSDAEAGEALKGLAAAAARELGCSPAVECGGFEGPFVCCAHGCGRYDASLLQHTAHMQSHGTQHACSEECLAAFLPSGAHACTAVGCPFSTDSTDTLRAHELLHTRVVFMQAGTVKELQSSFLSAKASESKASTGSIHGTVQGLTQQVLKATQSIILENC